MTKKAMEFDNKQLKEQSEYLNRMIKLKNIKPLTEREKDWFNLQFARTKIMHNSISYRSGLIKTFRNSIKRLEKEMDNEELIRVKTVFGD